MARRSWIWQLALLYVALAVLVAVIKNRDEALAEALRLWPEPSVVEMATWPQAVELLPGETMTFFAALQLSDGTQLCTDSTPEAQPPPWTHAAECDSAVALLAPYEAQDTAFVRFSWDTISTVSYDSLFYHVIIRSGIDTTHFLDDIAMKHPTAQLDWKNGVPWTEYDVAAYAEGFFEYAGTDTFAAGSLGVWTRFEYPKAYPVPVRMGPVRVDTVP
jgi:hypothetical protein